MDLLSEIVSFQCSAHLPPEIDSSGSDPFTFYPTQPWASSRSHSPRSTFDLQPVPAPASDSASSFGFTGATASLPTSSLALGQQSWRSVLPAYSPLISPSPFPLPLFHRHSDDRIVSQLFSNHNPSRSATASVLGLVDQACMPNADVASASQNLSADVLDFENLEWDNNGKGRRICIRCTLCDAWVGNSAMTFRTELA